MSTESKIKYLNELKYYSMMNKLIVSKRFLIG